MLTYFYVIIIFYVKYNLLKFNGADYKNNINQNKIILAYCIIINSYLSFFEINGDDRLLSCQFEFPHCK